MDDYLTSYGANEAANYGHKPLVAMSFDAWKEKVDREFFEGWWKLREVPLNRDVEHEG
jgi:hypothetical protein